LKLPQGLQGAAAGFSWALWQVQTQPKYRPFHFAQASVNIPQRSFRKQGFLATVVVQGCGAAWAEGLGAAPGAGHGFGPGEVMATVV
jgi:hypothetical protein